jgi:hypothetical protein
MAANADLIQGDQRVFPNSTSASSLSFQNASSTKPDSKWRSAHVLFGNLPDSDSCICNAFLVETSSYGRLFRVRFDGAMLLQVLLIGRLG